MFPRALISKRRNIVFKHDLKQEQGSMRSEALANEMQGVVNFTSLGQIIY
jgi:hypothetical protein